MHLIFYLSKDYFSIPNLINSCFSVITILYEFIYPYKFPCAVSIRLQSEMTTNFEGFIITYFSIPFTIKAIVIKPCFCDNLSSLVLFNLFSYSG